MEYISVAIASEDGDVSSTRESKESLAHILAFINVLPLTSPPPPHHPLIESLLPSVTNCLSSLGWQLVALAYRLVDLSRNTFTILPRSIGSIVGTRTLRGCKIPANNSPARFSAN